MAKDGQTDAPPSSRSSFQRFEKVMKALIAVPKDEVQKKSADIRRHRQVRAKKKAETGR
jgi:hypothetical protein